MARFRRRRSGGARRRQRLVWDTLDLVQADLPVLILDSTAARDGAFSGIKRYDGTDLTVKRTIFDVVGRITVLDEPVALDAVLEICIGLGWFDSQTDADGLAIATTMANGTGPLTDADNNKWYARCCVDIPIGSWMPNFTVAGRGMVVPIAGKTGLSGHAYIIGSGAPTTVEMGFHCHWDSKAQRRQHGIETPFLNLAVEARISITPAAGDDVTIRINKFSGRHVLAISS